MEQIKPQHMNASSDDLLGNQGIGRYVFLTGSDERAREISERFNLEKICTHPRNHNLYLGTINGNNRKIDVAAISTGMGGPSADIIINELIMLGAKRLLRIGTAGSLQPEKVFAGDVVIATAAVRDDKASWDYIYKEYPAIASMEYLIAAERAKTHSASLKTHFGIVHSKSSLYAREYLLSLMQENENYMITMRKAGVLASEMECAQLFILSSLMSSKLQQTILCGCILAIVGDKTSFSTDKELIEATITAAINLGIETTKEMDLINRP